MRPRLNHFDGDFTSGTTYVHPLALPTAQSTYFDTVFALVGPPKGHSSNPSNKYCRRRSESLHASTTVWGSPQVCGRERQNTSKIGWLAIKTLCDRTRSQRRCYRHEACIFTSRGTFHTFELRGLYDLLVLKRQRLHSAVSFAFQSQQPGKSYYSPYWITGKWTAPVAPLRDLMIQCAFQCLNIPNLMFGRSKLI